MIIFPHCLLVVCSFPDLQSSSCISSLYKMSLNGNFTDINVRLAGFVKIFSFSLNYLENNFLEFE